MSLTAERSRPSTTIAPPDQRGDRLVAGALLIAAGVLVLYQLLAGHVIPPLAVFAALTTVIAGPLLRRRPRWLLALAAGVAVLYLGGSVPFVVANLAHPESPVSFLAEAFLVLAFVTAIVGVVLRWRGAGDAARRRLVAGAVGIGLVGVVVSLVTAASVDSAARQDGDVPLVTDRSVWPDEVEVTAGGVLWVDNRDPFHHTFVIDGTDVHEVLAANSAVRLPVDLGPGSYRYWCDVPGHESMEGTLHVR